MTNEHPITPPPELVAKLWREASAGRDDAPIGEIFNHGVYLAYAAGADQELEACCEWLEQEGYLDACHSLGAARRPKPPSLKEQALEALGPEPLPETGPTRDTILNVGTIERHRIVRRALEALDD
jgi:hypothetical protein